MLSNRKIGRNTELELASYMASFIDGIYCTSKGQKINVSGPDLMSPKYYFEVKSIAGSPIVYYDFLYHYLAKWSDKDDVLQIKEISGMWCPKVCFLNTFLKFKDKIWDKEVCLVGMPTLTSRISSHFNQLLSYASEYKDKLGMLLVRLRRRPIANTLVFKMEGTCLKRMNGMK